MNQTLLVIPHEWLGWPLQLAWWFLVAGVVAWTARSEGLAKAIGLFAPFAVAVSLLIYFVIPAVEVQGLNPEDPLGAKIPLGIAIRGYGVCLTLAILAAVGLVFRRSSQVGLDLDRMFTLCFSMVIVGILGARIFYVVQKWDQFQFVNLPQFLVSIVDMTKGGLVVYGSLFGAFLVLALAPRILKLPTRLVLDVVAPAMLLGLAIGRIGCLMNGCCYGGECPPEYPLGIRFPVEAPAYYDQLRQGRLLGLRGDWEPEADYPLKVTAIEPEGYAATKRLPIEVGERLNIVTPGADFLVGIKSGQIDVPMAVLIEREGSEEPLRIPVAELPNRSLKVHPAQVYAAISAALVCAVLWFAFPLRKFDGQLFAGLLMLYPTSRLLEEVIRSDENGIFGTPLTISQWVSVLLVIVGIGMWWWLSRRPVLTWRVGAN